MTPGPLEQTEAVPITWLCHLVFPQAVFHTVLGGGFAELLTLHLRTWS